MPKPPLLKALERNCLEDVRKALAAEPAAACELFYDHGLDPPLCAAANWRCGRPIFELLLAGGADAEAETTEGLQATELISGHGRLGFSTRRAGQDFDELMRLLVSYGGKCCEQAPQPSMASIWENRFNRFGY